MADLGVREAAHHVDQRVDLAEAPEGLPSEPLAAPGARCEPGDVDHLHLRGDPAGDVLDVRDRVDPRVGYVGRALPRLAGGVRIYGHLGRVARDQVEE